MTELAAKFCHRLMILFTRKLFVDRPEALIYLVLPEQTYGYLVQNNQAVAASPSAERRGNSRIAI